MQTLPIDVTDLVAIIMATLIVLIPVAGITSRFAMKPLVESSGRFMQLQGSDEALEISERRIALLAQNPDAVEGELRRIRDARDFDRALRSGDDPRALPTGGSGPAATS